MLDQSIKVSILFDIFCWDSFTNEFISDNILRQKVTD